ncbi:IDEAL domain-containing protein [Sporolactobacillus shoreae]|uniref:IDEAL domain-containing protein n=1 Tax=Sporolactobacillus shoreae TaxID=1465501 RepID=A0A4Z0GMQ2_9BACL|nr:YpiB family protein [Sporolactobacillus shoreae]TGA98124.1 IDEAL domain-containing protein [Sporolactobacillus shoreae]
MEQTVSTVQKKSFIKWLLNQQVIKDREIIWLLNYMMGNKQLLQLIHFVDNVFGCKRAIEIDATSQTPSGFEYTKDSVHTDDPEKTFHDLRLNQADNVYIKVNLPSVIRSPEYFVVLEEGPNAARFVHHAFGSAAEAATGAAEKAYAEERLKTAINQALDDGDETAFYKLTEKLRALGITGESVR